MPQVTVETKSVTVQQFTTKGLPRLEFYDRSNNALLVIVEVEGESFKVNTVGRIEVVVYADGKVIDPKEV